MADFCKQCSVGLWPDKPEGYNDFIGLSTFEDTCKGLYAIVLCEGCGPCQVDHLGNCVSSDCHEKHGGPPHDWTPSTLGHGEKMCKRCSMTNREATALGKSERCDMPP